MKSTERIKSVTTERADVSTSNASRFAQECELSDLPPT